MASSRLLLWFCLALVGVALAACSQYGATQLVVLSRSTQAGAPSFGYLIDRIDWVLGVKEELMVLKLDVPSSGRSVQFNGRRIFIPSGSQVLAWRCGEEWQYKEVIVDGPRFPDPELTPWCPT